MSEFGLETLVLLIGPKRAFHIALDRIGIESLKILSPGRGYLVYLVDGDVPFFRVSLSPIFYRAGYQSKGVFLEQVVTKAHFL